SSSLAGDLPAGNGNEEVGSRLAREMRRRWRGGERPAAEDFLNQHPELWQRPEAAIDLIYEEYCLRRAAGESGGEQEIVRRFRQGAGPWRLMLECDHVLPLGRDLPQFPAVGDTVGEFRLRADLGSGSRGRVFLGAHTTLADRPVVLKITP